MKQSRWILLISGSERQRLLLPQRSAIDAQPQTLHKVVPRHHLDDRIAGGTRGRSASWQVSAFLVGDGGNCSTAPLQGDQAGAAWPLVGIKAQGAHCPSHGSSRQGFFNDLAVDHEAGEVR